jgi:hypothetical protein
VVTRLSASAARAFVVTLLVALHGTAFADPDARAILESHCGVCHREDSPDAQPRALAVFNLNRAVWWSTMTAAQLRNAVERLRNLQVSSTAEARAVARDFATFGGPVTDDELRTFRAFAAFALTARALRVSY